jgi:hypothetical protein
MASCSRYGLSSTICLWDYGFRVQGLEFRGYGLSSTIRERGEHVCRVPALASRA